MEEKDTWNSTKGREFLPLSHPGHCIMAQTLLSLWTASHGWNATHHLPCWEVWTLSKYFICFFLIIHSFSGIQSIDWFSGLSQHGISGASLLWLLCVFFLFSIQLASVWRCLTAISMRDIGLWFFSYDIWFQDVSNSYNESWINTSNSWRIGIHSLNVQ